MSKPLFSILHTSARPDKWRAVYDDWMSKAVDPSRVEYVLCVDPRWGFSLDAADYELFNLVVVQNTARRCYVDGVNIAAAASSGSILIVNADDQFACEGWDAALKCLDQRRAILEPSSRAFVVEADCGGQEFERGIMPMPILSRARYEQQGSVVFYPEYESMYADNDFCEWARLDGVVIDARHLLFPHKHPMYAGWQGVALDDRWDAAYQAQNRREASELGRDIFMRRRASGFGPLNKKRLLALALPGERFSGAYLQMILKLQGHILLNRPDLDLVDLNSYTSNPYITREDIRRELANMPQKPDLVLTLDDDNLLSVEHFEKLMEGMDSHPEAEIIAGYCYIHNEEKTGFMLSVGEWAPDGLHWNPFPMTFVNKRGLQPFETGGFPCLLMRYSALEKAQADAEKRDKAGCFLPILDRRLPHGMSGEDMAFFWHAGKAGVTMLVDPQVRVPHLKTVSVEPVLPDEGKSAVKVACMMRVKNEARWIARCIESVRLLCGSDIYVLEDGSIDGTAEIAAAAGAVVIPSPFAGMPLDEARDKNWLYAEVMKRCSPDWILMPDGDEELEPGGCSIIRRALDTNPDCDSIALGFLYLWNSVDQFRVDGCYGTMSRQSLFRANSDFKFKSYYSTEETGNQNHVGLHTSNAPGLGGKVFRIRVNLLHYGYLHREDRIRKYQWILSIDPHNEGEGYYLHCVQGDVPEVPADMRLEFKGKHFGGPLELKKLPASKIPKFEGPVPGPFDPARVEAFAD